MSHIAWMGRSPRRKRKDANRIDERVRRMQRRFCGNARLDFERKKMSHELFISHTRRCIYTESRALVIYLVMPPILTRYRFRG